MIAVANFIQTSEGELAPHSPPKQRKRHLAIPFPIQSFFIEKEKSPPPHHHRVLEIVMTNIYVERETMNLNTEPPLQIQQAFRSLLVGMPECRSPTPIRPNRHRSREDFEPSSAIPIKPTRRRSKQRTEPKSTRVPTMPSRKPSEGSEVDCLVTTTTTATVATNLNQISPQSVKQFLPWDAQTISEHRLFNLRCTAPAMRARGRRELPVPS